MLPGFGATQHFVAPLLELAPRRYEANVRRYHRLDDEIWMVAGWYVLETVDEADGDADEPGSRWC